jgi:uncharacterized protein YxjI
MAKTTTAINNLASIVGVTVIVDKITQANQSSYIVMVYNSPNKLQRMIAQSLIEDNIPMVVQDKFFSFITQERELTQEYVLSIHGSLLADEYSHKGFETSCRANLDREFYKLSSKHMISQKEYPEKMKLLLRSVYC